jgi:hypothetical protein
VICSRRTDCPTQCQLDTNHEGEAACPILLIYGAPGRKLPIMLHPPSGLSATRTVAHLALRASRDNPLCRHARQRLTRRYSLCRTLFPSTVLVRRIRRSAGSSAESAEPSDLPVLIWRFTSARHLPKLRTRWISECGRFQRQACDCLGPGRCADNHRVVRTVRQRPIFAEGTREGS